jgi:hypothetical protein
VHAWTTAARTVRFEDIVDSERDEQQPGKAEFHWQGSERMFVYAGFYQSVGK